MEGREKSRFDDLIVGLIDELLGKRSRGSTTHAFVDIGGVKGEGAECNLASRIESRLNDRAICLY
jgi:hypothetical protein